MVASSSSSVANVILLIKIVNMMTIDLICIDLVLRLQRMLITPHEDKVLTRVIFIFSFDMKK